MTVASLNTAREGLKHCLTQRIAPLHGLSRQRTLLGGLRCVLTPLPASVVSMVQHSSWSAEPKRTFSSQVSRSQAVPVERIRNVAIIAHVDHGKTTLVDSLLRKTNACTSITDRLMDQGELEKEKGITILSKATRIVYQDHVLNIVDTPGHADFGGEVERVLSMVDGAILLVDIASGPRAQTRFVLSKALQDASLIPIVVVNKIDRNHGRKEGEIENEIFELFVSLDASEIQMDYPILYGSAKQGWITEDWKSAQAVLGSPNALAASNGVIPLLEKIIAHVPSPKAKLERLREEGILPPVAAETTENVQLLQENVTKDFSMLASMVEVSPVWGHIVTGQVYSGMAAKEASIVFLKLDPQQKATSKATRIKEVLVAQGISKVPVPLASPGDIVSLQLSGGQVPGVYDTLAASASVNCIPVRPISPPVMGVDVCPNTSPLQGKDGTKGSLFEIKARLAREALVNVGIQVEDNVKKSGVTLKGRGDLQIGVLLETMRREGYEFEVTSPDVVLQYDAKGNPLEPWEQYTLLVPTSLGPELLDVMSRRHADYVTCETLGDGVTEYVFNCASRHFFGMASWLQSNSRGTASFTSEPLGYRPYISKVHNARPKAVIATCAGSVVAFELQRFQNDCSFFVAPNDPVYEGMVVGETEKLEDLLCNVCKPRKIVAVRVSGKSKEDALKPSIPTSIEFCLNYIEEDELVEVTPKRIAMRKKILCNDARAKQAQKKQKGVCAHSVMILWYSQIKWLFDSSNSDK